MRLLKLVPDNTNIDFMRWRTLALVLSVLVTVASLAIDHVSGIQGRVTVSIGIAAITPTLDQPARELIEAADGALYRAKRAGRNQAVVAATHRHAA